MKKIAFALCWMAGAAVAQKGNLEIGLNAGWQSARISSVETGSPVLKTSARNGIGAGISAAYFWAGHWSARVQLAYDQKGVQGHVVRAAMDQASGYSYRDIYSDFELDYLNLPVTVQWHYGEKLRWTLGGGAYIGYLTGSNQDASGGMASPVLSDTDYGWVASTGLQWPAAPSLRIGLEYEFQQGLAEVFAVNPFNSAHTNIRHAVRVGIFYLL